MAVIASAQYRRFVEKVRYIRARESAGYTRERLEIYVRRHGFVARVNLEDRFSAANVGNIDVDLTVESAGAQKRRVENVRAVGRRHDDYAVVGGETVHLDEELVKCLFAFVVTAAEPRSALTAYRVDLVDKDNARHILFSRVEEVANAACAHADVHFHEVRAGNREERYVRFARYRLGEQGFAGAGRTYEKYAAGDSRAHRREFLR